MLRKSIFLAFAALLFGTALALSVAPATAQTPVVVQPVAPMAVQAPVVVQPVAPVVTMPAFRHGYQVLFRPAPRMAWQVYGVYGGHRSSHEIARALRTQGFQTRIVQF
jgi:hypothetical protein